MTIYTRKTLLAACATFLGKESVDAMLGARISLPEVVRCASLEAFIRDTRDANAEIIREALYDLYRTEAGHFQFQGF